MTRHSLLLKTSPFVVDGHAVMQKPASLNYTDKAASDREALFEVLLDTLPVPVFYKNRQGGYIGCNKAFENFFDGTRDEIIGKTVFDISPEDLAEIHHARDEALFREGGIQQYESKISTALGVTRDVFFNKSVIADEKGEPAGLIGAVLDITERKQAENAVNAMRTQLLSVLQTIPDMVWLKDAEGVYLLCNHAFERLVGRVEADIVGKTDYDLFGYEMAQFFRDNDRAAIEAGRVLINEEWVTCEEDGQSILLETRKVPVSGEGSKVNGILGVGRDITELHASRQKIHHMAFYDPLTALPNRALFNDRLRQMITDAAYHGHLAGVMLIDMDHFKAVNDTMGHPVGDELLCQAAARLNASVRDYDTVARLGGDEFAILLPDIRQGDDLGRIANKILEKFNERFLLGKKEVFISCSIGIALYPDDSIDANDLMKYADSAMYLAKRSGRNRFRFYSKDLTASAEERLRLESELRRAIERGELELHYQPKVLLGTGLIIGSEALLRWRHPEMGMIPPSQFIGIAEDCGLITNIGRWVLQEACQTAAELNAGDLPLHKVAINLSAPEFQCQNLPGRVAAILEKTGCRPQWIEIEITESLLLDEKGDTLETLSELRAMGISIAIDDFGTGYSALNYLVRFPIDTLKIDRSFIGSDDKRSAELVKAILSIARCLGQNVVAEGVETIEQAAFLRENGCAAAQGFLYSKPVPKAELMILPRRFGDISLAC